MAKETIELVREAEIKAVKAENEAQASADKIRENAKAKAEEIIKSAEDKAKDLIKTKKAETEAELLKIRDEEQKSIDVKLKQLERDVKSKEDKAIKTVISIISGV